ncbi:MAG: tetratricopeptide repeat protein [Planctomycetaceae bacterium]
MVPHSVSYPREIGGGIYAAVQKMRSKWTQLTCLALIAGVSGGLCAYRISATSGETLAKARLELAAGQPQAARTTLKWLLFVRPQHGDALLLAGMCCLKEQDPASAVKFFERVPIVSDQHRSASLAAAFAWLNSGHLENCEGAFRRHLERYPNSTAAYRELKWLYFNQFRVRELEAFLEDQLTQSENSYPVLLDALYTEIREQVAQEAVVPLRRANDAHSDQAVVLLALGYCHWQLGDLKLAHEQLERALQLRPEHVETRLIVAEFLLEQGQIRAARDLLLSDGRDAQTQQTTDSLPARFPKHDRWHWLLHRIALIDESPEKAMPHLQSALDLRPFDLQYMQARGSLLQSLGQADAAAKVFEQIAPQALAKQRLLQIVLTENLEEPTVELCREVAELYEVRGRSKLASGWRMIADQRQNFSGTLSPPEEKLTPAFSF